jgi:DNA-directed RNA polymerase subunit RPC12/RpoP
MDLYSCKSCERRYLSLAPHRVGGRCPDCGARLIKVWMPELPRAEAGSFPDGDHTYASMEDFVRADLDRLSSREIDFGVLWRDGANTSYRAAWVEETGELYVVQAGQPSGGGGHVEVLGVTDRAGVEAALEGWQARAEEHASIGWIRRRAAQLPRVSSRPRRPPGAARAGGSGGSALRSSLSGGWRPSRAGG